MSIRTFSVVLLVLSVFCACSPADDVQLLAVQSGRPVKKVVSPYGEYLYEYDAAGRVSSIIHDKDEYKYDYPEDNKVVVTGQGYTRTYVYGEYGELESVHFMFSDDVDAGTISFAHTDGFPVTCTLDSDIYTDYVLYEYVWEEGNCIRQHPLNVSDDFSLSSIESSYSSGIINNYNVPLPCFWSFVQLNESLIYPVMRCRNLPDSIGDRTFGYERNPEGDICKIEVNGNQRHEVYEIEY